MSAGVGVRMANLFLGLCCVVSALILTGGWYVARSWHEATNVLTVLANSAELLGKKEERLLREEADLKQGLLELQDEKTELQRREAEMERVASGLSQRRAEAEQVPWQGPPTALLPLSTDVSKQ